MSPRLTAYDAGHQAYTDKQLVNPYPTSKPHLHKQWQMGYDTAERVEFHARLRTKGYRGSNPIITMGMGTGCP